MIVIHSPLQAQHAPEHEFFRGERVPCFETPARAEIVCRELAARGHTLQLPTADSRPLLAKVHEARYLSFIESAWNQWLAADPANARVQPFPSVWPIRTLRSDEEPANFIARLGLYSFDNGTPISAGTWQAAKAGADAAASAAGLIAGGERHVFCATRPPGHHAGRDFMGGYCFINNAAVAAEALRSHGCARVAVLDVDFHHGNGTQAIFYDRADVLVVSIHGDPRTEYPFYSGYVDETGTGEGKGCNRNLPLPRGTEADAWFAAFDSAAATLARFGAEALVVSLGLDTFAGDPISGFRLQSDDYLRLGGALARLDLPAVLILEGGYATAELGINAANVIDGIANG